MKTELPPLQLKVATLKIDTGKHALTTAIAEYLILVESREGKRLDKKCVQKMQLVLTISVKM